MNAVLGEGLRRTFVEEVRFPDCSGRLHLIALVKKEEAIRVVLTVLHFPTGPQKEAKVLLPRTREEELGDQEGGESMDGPEYPD